MSDPSWIHRLRQRLLDFFHRTRGDRAMPWRETLDPYAIWVSEVMLQQTRVETVIPYYRAWMQRFPTVEALADAPQEDVLKRWEGLGYYSRARNLHSAARVVRERHGGRLPADLKELRDLPGVGAYTAGAVASIAFGLSTPAVDGNVRRVASRLLDLPDPPPKRLEDVVGRWVPRDEPGDFNQALMELGATICLPRNPLCEVCPVSDLCEARVAGTVDVRPAPRKRATVRKEVHAVTVAVRSGASVLLALRRRPPEGLLAGMYEFPARVLPTGEEEAAVEGLPLWTAEEGPVVALPEVLHAFSHLHVTYRPVLVRLPEEAPPPPEARWLTPVEIGALPLPVAQQSIVRSALEVLGVVETTD
jgi:A/G-specific adenine glycosylase